MARPSTTFIGAAKCACGATLGPTPHLVLRSVASDVSRSMGAGSEQDAILRDALGAFGTGGDENAGYTEIADPAARAFVCRVRAAHRAADPPDRRRLARLPRL